MGNQNVIKIAPEVIAAMQKQAEQMAKVGASINEVMSAADGLRQTFLDIYTKEAVKNIKV
jgi:hypothetical protein